MKKVLVTGSRGFVGKELVRQLRESGEFEATEFSRSLGNNVANFEDVLGAVKKADFVVHAAALLKGSPEEFEKTNVLGTKNVLEACAKEEKRLVHISSTSVFGDFQEKADEGTAVQAGQKADYGRTKAQADLLAQQYFGKIALTILRPPFIYGNNAAWKLISEFSVSGIPLFGSGKTIWHLLYVKDLCSAIIFCLREKKTIGEIFVVAGPETCTVEQVFLALSNNLGRQKKKLFLPLWLGRIALAAVKPLAGLVGRGKVFRGRSFEVFARNSSYNTKKIQALGWKPAYGLEEGFAEMAGEMGTAKLV